MMLFATMLSALVMSVSAQAKPDPKDSPPQPTAITLQPAAPVCPKLEVRTATQPIRDGTLLKFSVGVSGGDVKSTPVFSWTVSAGMISSGQGTATIDVDTTGAGADKSIAASLLIIGFPPECSAEASATVPIAGPAKKLDEFGVLKVEDESARLDSFIATVTPSERAYVFAYAGRTGLRGQASADLKRIRAYLLKTAPAERLVTIDGGFRESPAFELWWVPVGAESPRPSPTVNPKEIVYPKPTPPVKKPSL